MGCCSGIEPGADWAAECAAFWFSMLVMPITSPGAGDDMVKRKPRQRRLGTVGQR